MKMFLHSLFFCSLQVSPPFLASNRLHHSLSNGNPFYPVSSKDRYLLPPLYQPPIPLQSTRKLNQLRPLSPHQHQRLSQLDRLLAHAPTPTYLMFALLLKTIFSPIPFSIVISIRVKSKPTGTQGSLRTVPAMMENKVLGMFWAGVCWMVTKGWRGWSFF